MTDTFTSVGRAASSVLDILAKERQAIDTRLLALQHDRAAVYPFILMKAREHVRIVRHGSDRELARRGGFDESTIREAKLLERVFGLPVPKAKPKPDIHSARRRRAINELLADPTASLLTLSKRAGCSRSLVGTIRQQLKAEGKI